MGFFQGFQNLPLADSTSFQANKPALSPLYSSILNELLAQVLHI